MKNKFEIGDLVWVETSDHSASRAIINYIEGDSYYVHFIDYTNRQHNGEGTKGVPILTKKIQPIDYIGWEK
jgi:hypothetical protein